MQSSNVTGALRNAATLRKQFGFLAVASHRLGEGRIGTSNDCPAGFLPGADGG
jgi:hypothetical protein